MKHSDWSAISTWGGGSIFKMRAAGQVPYSVGSCHGEWISDFIPEMMGEDISNQNLSLSITGAVSS